MKICTLSFYYDFTRYFNSIAIENSEVCVKNFCCAPSAFLSRVSKNCDNIFLPFAIRLNRQKYPLSDEITRWIASYYEDMRTQNNKYESLAKKYYSYFYNFLQVEMPDVFIISGDSRLQSRAASQACLDLGIKVVYFEQGPFGTTQLDLRGVNCNASFNAEAILNSYDSEKIPEQKLDICVDEKVKNDWLRSIDYFTSLITYFGIFLELVEEKSMVQKLSKLWSKLHYQKHADINFEHEDYVLVIGQVPTDANFKLHSQFENTTEFVKTVIKMFPYRKIFIRDHPLLAGGYEKEFYDLVSHNAYVSIASGALEPQINNASDIVVVNSTVGLEAILQYRRCILVLGNSIYDCLPGANKYPKHAGAKYLSDNEHQFALYWFNTHFKKGHFRDKDLHLAMVSLKEFINDVTKD